MTKYSDSIRNWNCRQEQQIKKEGDHKKMVSLVLYEVYTNTNFIYIQLSTLLKIRKCVNLRVCVFQKNSAIVFHKHFLSL